MNKFVVPFFGAWLLGYLTIVVLSTIFPPGPQKRADWANSNELHFHAVCRVSHKDTVLFAPVSWVWDEPLENCPKE